MPLHVGSVEDIREDYDLAAAGRSHWRLLHIGHVQNEVDHHCSLNVAIFVLEGDETALLNVE